MLFAWFALANNNKRKFQFSFHSSGSAEILERSSLFAFFIFTVELLQQYYSESSVPFGEAIDPSKRGHIGEHGYGPTPLPVKDRLPLCYSAVLKIFTLVPNLVDTSSFFYRLDILDRAYTWKKREDLDRVFDTRFGKELQVELYTALKDSFQGLGTGPLIERRKLLSFEEEHNFKIKEEFSAWRDKGAITRIPRKSKGDIEGVTFFTAFHQTFY